METDGAVRAAGAPAAPVDSAGRRLGKRMGGAQRVLDAHAAQVRALWQRGLGHADIARQFGVADHHVQFWCRKHGLDRGQVRGASAPAAVRARPIVIGPPHRTCQFIAADPAGKRGAALDALYCGRPTVEGSSYCGAHLALCYRPPEPGRSWSPERREAHRLLMKRLANEGVVLGGRGRAHA